MIKNLKAYYPLTTNFSRFFNRLNPSPTFQLRASSQYRTVKSLIENKIGLASQLSPICFLQGSYKQATAIYTINDIDIVALCRLRHPSLRGGRSWSRDDIFNTISAPLNYDKRYKNKVHYNHQSMCIKVDLGIKIEILPVVYKVGNTNPQKEPFLLYRPDKQQWEYGYARYHQMLLTKKNRYNLTRTNFIPAIKVLKHLRSRFGLDAVSFHIECLLYSINDKLFYEVPANYITAILVYIASISAEDWYGKVINTPCGERDIFVDSEWEFGNWKQFHHDLVLWASCAVEACQEKNRNRAIDLWQQLLGADFFPRQVSQ